MDVLTKYQRLSDLQLYMGSKQYIEKHFQDDLRKKAVLQQLEEYYKDEQARDYRTNLIVFMNMYGIEMNVF